MMASLAWLHLKLQTVRMEEGSDWLLQSLLLPFRLDQRPGSFHSCWISFSSSHLEGLQTSNAALAFWPRLLQPLNGLSASHLAAHLIRSSQMPSASEQMGSRAEDHRQFLATKPLTVGLLLTL